MSVVQTGSWLYAGSVKAGIRIVRCEIRYGSGDHEDPEDIREDREVTCYEVQYESPPRSGAFRTSGGVHETLEQAMADVERICGGSVTWELS